NLDDAGRSVRPSRPGKLGAVGSRLIFNSVLLSPGLTRHATSVAIWNIADAPADVRKHRRMHLVVENAWTGLDCVSALPRLVFSVAAEGLPALPTAWSRSP